MRHMGLFPKSSPFEPARNASTAALNRHALKLGHAFQIGKQILGLLEALLRRLLEPAQ
jgi:hypothetical protein